MNKITRQVVLISSALLFSNIALSSVPNHDHPTTFLGPTIKGSYTSPLFNDNAFSVLGEAGFKNFRIGSTYGWQFMDNQRIKFSAEYLRQNITYAFFSGNTNQWVQQGAIGAGYQLDLACNDFLPQFDLSAYYSYAPTKTLSTVTGIFVDSSGVTQNFTNERRIAGSNAAGIEPGFTIRPWTDAQLSLGLNYDHVHYRKTFAPSENANGLGGTVRFNQILFQVLNLNLSAAVRKPYNNYFAKLSWAPSYYNNWRFGIDGDYTAGKETLPNTYNAGIDIDYIFDCGPRDNTFVRRGLKGETAVGIIPPSTNHFTNWVGDPAVYMPQVLAVVDQHTTTSSSCGDGIVTLLSPIPNQFYSGFAAGTNVVATAPFFSGNNLTFSMTQQNNITNGSASASINSSTGEVTFVNSDTTAGTLTITVTASNGCGSASSTFVANYTTD